MTANALSDLRNPTAFLEDVAVRVRRDVVGDITTRPRRIFLCGATATDKTSVRERIARDLRKRVEVHYPEHLFDELLTGPGHQDLLSLENLLADGVDAIVIVLEGVGAFTELGAFANHERLRKKLIVVQDSRYARDRSFIQLGPIRLLRAQGERHVVSIDFRDAEGAENIVRLLYSRISSLHEEGAPFKIDNLFHTQDFILPILYVLHTLSRNELVHALDHVAKVGLQRAQAIAIGSLAMLRAERLVVSTDLGITLTRRGQEKVRRPVDGGALRDRTLDALQVDVIHRKYRYQKGHFSGS